MSDDVSTGRKVFLILATVVGNLAFGIGAIVIGSQYMGQQCAKPSAPPLDTWLLVFGITALVSMAIAIPLIIFLEKAAAVFLVYILLFGMFNFAWMIVGSVALFRDCPSCQSQAYPLWAMSLAVLIMMYINVVINCLAGYKKKD